MNCSRVLRSYPLLFKISFSFFLILLTATPSISQVQKKFFNATLGVSDINTTYHLMSNYFGKKPSPIHLEKQILSMRNTVYAGYKWDGINAIFHNGKLAQVNFRILGYSQELSSQDIIYYYNSLKKSLMAKYSNILKMQSFEENWQCGICFYDGRYEVFLTTNAHLNKEKEKEFYEVNLLYSDVQLLKEPEINVDL